MHELSITRNVVASVAERAAGRRVRAVQLRIGLLSGIDVQAIRFCFDLCAQGTALEGARLDIEEVAGRGACQACGAEVLLDRAVLACSCAQRGPVRVIAGEELLIRSMEVASV